MSFINCMNLNNITFTWNMINIQLKTSLTTNIYQVKQNHKLDKQYFNCHTDNISFSGLHNLKAKSLFCFDLDGSLVNGAVEHLNEYIKKILEFQKKKNGILVYNTGRNLDKFTQLQTELAQKQVHLPTPDYLIARNGLYIYENKNGKLIENNQWNEHLAKTFDAQKIDKIMEKMALQPKYIMPKEKIKLHNIDPKNNTTISKICKFEFWPSPKMVQYVIDSSLSNDIEKLINKQLKPENMRYRLINQIFSKEICDKVCTKEQLDIINPRYSNDNYMTQLDITSANKADGIQFLKKQLKIPYNEIVMAGDDANDISAAALTQKGAYFICVNPTKPLEEFVNKLKAKLNNKFTENVIIAENKGIVGIFEGMNSLLSLIKNNKLGKFNEYSN